MLHDFLNLLTQILASVVGGACLLRVWLRLRGESWQKLVPAPLLTVLTGWLVTPLETLAQALRLPVNQPGQRWDVISLLVAFVLELLRQAVLLSALRQPPWSAWLPLALLGVLWMALSVAQIMVLLTALASWLRPGMDELRWLERLTRPLLAPARRLLPPFKGIDWSPLLVLLVLYLLGVGVSYLQERLVQVFLLLK